MAEEFFDVLDENGQKTGIVKARSAVHRDGDWHAAVDMVILNEKDEILLELRSPNKDSYPNMWDICGGHVTAGEDCLSTAVRELKEELDLEVKPEDLLLIEQYKTSSQPAEDFINNSFENVYLVRTNYKLEDYKVQEEEVADIQYMPWRELRERLAAKQPDIVPHSRQYAALFEMLESSSR